MPLPPLTHLQFAVLSIVGAREVAGRVIRKRLAEDQRIRISGPAFYQAMARMEDAKFVEGKYVQRTIGGQLVKERTYTILGAGVKAVEAAREFYARKLPAGWGVAHA